ncbi:spermidine/putrescine ABC transporter permease PotB [Arsenophonus endosymbiont of Lipoptena cervi]|uniref:spermidine/putrescine ABC transporter permease PotB n=1 Tax=Arsenophonus endosymbiont of Lipoptena cervi TaxID=363258 RepID=UPI00376EA62E
MRINSKKFQNIIIIWLFSWLLLFVFLPNLIIIITSFLTHDDKNLIKIIFTLNNYKRLFNSLYANVILNSINIAIITTLFCLIISYPLALLLTQISIKLQSLMLFLLILPFCTNSLIRIYGLRIFLSARGFLNNFLLYIKLIDKPIQILYTQKAVIIGLVYILLPFMVIPIYSSIQKLDKYYFEAAKDLGANKFQIFLRITVPLTKQGVIAGCILVSISAMGLFYIADLMGGAKNLLIGNIIKNQFLYLRDWPFGSAISITLTILISGIAFLLSYYQLDDYKA